MKNLRQITKLLYISFIAILLISCTKKTEAPKQITQQTPEEFVQILFTENNPDNYVHYIKHADKYYDENGNIKDESIGKCLETSEDIRASFQEFDKEFDITIGESYTTTVDGLGELKVIPVYDEIDEMNVIEFYLLPTNKTYQLYFNSSIGYNNPSFLQFKVGNDINTPTTFRVMAELDDYYNFSFRDKSKTHYSISLRELTGDILYGYIEKESETGKELYELLKDGNEHKAVLEIHFPDNEESKSSTVVIDRILSESWVYPE